jgi:AbrB family looped-hinge helix DNA binding protein
MPTKNKREFNHSSTNEKTSCCKVESVVSVDDRGQMVLPKDLREKAQINAGDKLAVVTMEKDGKICCLSLIKVNKMEQMVKDMLSPVMREMLKEKKSD